MLGKQIAFQEVVNVLEIGVIFFLIGRSSVAKKENWRLTFIVTAYFKCVFTLIVGILCQDNYGNEAVYREVFAETIFVWTFGLAAISCIQIYNINEI